MISHPVRKKILQFLALFCTLTLFLFQAIPAAAACDSLAVPPQKLTGFHVDAPSAIVMEASTGAVLYEQDADLQKPPASVTKVMTLLLIFEAIDAGQITLSDSVTTSEHAASMGGSQVFLEAGESQTVETMIKCIAVASGNDAAVAMAEHIAGSEDAFVAKMNEQAAALGMKKHPFCQLLRPGRRGTLYFCQRYRHHVPGAHRQSPGDLRLYHHLDGKYHPCDHPRLLRVRSHQHHTTDPPVRGRHRIKDRQHFQSRVLPERHRHPQRHLSDRRSDGL